MFAIVSMGSITGEEMAKKSKSTKKNQQFRNVGKHCKSHIHCVRNVGNDDLKYVLDS